MRSFYKAGCSCSGSPSVDHNIDAVCLYQHTWRTGEATADSQQRRQEFWKALRTAVGKIPIRNDAIIAGDFNCHVRPFSPHVGSSVINAPSVEADESDFLSILQDFSLTLLNTWHHKLKATCLTSKVHSQIDFFYLGYSMLIKAPNRVIPRKQPLWEPGRLIGIILCRLNTD